MSKQIKSSDFMPFHVLIAAGGSGTRAGFDLPKQYKTINGKTILRHTIEKFMGIQGLKSIRVIIGDGHEDLYYGAVDGLNLTPPIMGAATRKQSVYNGLRSFAPHEQNDIVLIHDAARPFVSASSIHTILDSMKNVKAATLACSMADTLVTPVYKSLDRNAIHAIQTPQAFIIHAIKAAHEKYIHDDNFTDDAGLMAAMGEKITFIPSSRHNFKITTNDDFIMAEKLFENSRETRTGFGYDVHAFDPAPSHKIRLGGIDIPHNRKLLGHSDADVILHALTDAMLGTIGDGDIGQIFPPSDMTWKNADSKIFVAEAFKRVLEKGGKIINVDITLIAEEPKIGAHRTFIQKTIAGMLQISADRVGLKATTSEGLGFVGKKEGIVAQAVVSISFPSELGE